MLVSATCGRRVLKSSKKTIGSGGRCRWLSRERLAVPGPQVGFRPSLGSPAVGPGQGDALWRQARCGGAVPTRINLAPRARSALRPG